MSSFSLYRKGGLIGNQKPAQPISAQLNPSQLSSTHVRVPTLVPSAMMMMPREVTYERKHIKPNADPDLDQEGTGG